MGELDDLILDRRAIARPDTLDLAAVERRPVEVFPDDGVRPVVRIARVANDPVLEGRPGPKGEGHGRFVARLGGERNPVDGVRVEPHGCPRLKAKRFETGLFQVFRQVHGGWFIGPSGRVAVEADVDDAVEEGPGGNDHGPRPDLRAVEGPDAAGPARPDEELRDDPLEEGQARDRLEAALHSRPVTGLVALRSRRLDGPTPAAVEEAELDARLVRQEAHQPAQGVDLAHQVALGQAAHGRVA